MNTRWIFLLCALAWAVPTHLLAATLQGKVSFSGFDPHLSEPDAVDTVVFFKPDAGVTVSPLKGDITMTMVGKSFAPHVLVVTAGTAVRFPNDDPIFHNAFSPSAPNAFDLGVYDTGGGKSWGFEHQGLVRVYCNVHRDMFGYILVLDTPYFVKARDDGTFEITGLPAVAGELTIWNPRTQVWRQHFPGLAATGPLDVQLDVIANGVPEHLNKDGKPYFHHHTPGT